MNAHIKMKFNKSLLDQVPLEIKHLTKEIKGEIKGAKKFNIITQKEV